MRTSRRVAKPRADGGRWRKSLRSGRCRIAIEGDVTAYTARADMAMMLEALAASGELEIDLSGVSQMDSAGLQWLVVVKREALRAGKRMTIQGHSPAVLRLLDRYSLGSYFGDPIVISPEGR